MLHAPSHSMTSEDGSPNKGLERVATQLESKLQTRPDKAAVESQNLLKSAKTRADRIDFHQAQSVLTLHFRKRTLPGLQPAFLKELRRRKQQRSEERNKGDGKLGLNLTINLASVGVSPSPSSPGTPLSSLSELEEDEEEVSEMVAAASLNSRISESERAHLLQLIHNGQRDRAQRFIDRIMKRPIKALSPRPTSLRVPEKPRQRRNTVHATTVGQLMASEEDGGLSGSMVRDEEKKKGDGSGATTSRSDRQSSAAPHAARRQSSLHSNSTTSPRANGGGVGGGGGVSVSLVDRDSKSPDENEDETELRLLDSTLLLLDRIQLERSLEPSLAAHLKKAMSFVQSAQNICRLRSTNIERKWIKSLNLKASSQADAQIADWLTGEYLERRGSKSRVVLTTKPSTESLNELSTLSQHSQRHEQALMRRKKEKKSKRVSLVQSGSAWSQIEIGLRMPDVSESLKLVSEWNFDIFRLDEATNGRPLAILVFHLFQSSGIIKDLGLSTNKLCTFLNRIEDGYNRSVVYHNMVHAADVAQGIFFFLQSEVMRKCVSPAEMFAAVIAAAIHDHEHPGVNNNFLIQTGHHLALRYNDQSVLENHHVSSAFRVMKDPDSAILSGFSPEEQAEMRELMIHMVLATDMSKHVHGVAEFEALIQGKKSKGTWFDGSDKKDTMKLLSMGIHVCDLGNPARPRYLYDMWVEKLYEEFYSQGDKERELGFPISPMMDRYQPAIAKAQVGFIDYVVSPLFNQWNQVVTEADVCLKHLGANREYWAQQASKEAAANPNTKSGSSPRPRKVPKKHGTMR